MTSGNTHRFGLSSFQEAGGFQRQLQLVLFQHPGRLSFCLTFAAAMVVYLCTLAPEVTLEFSGYATTSAAYAGVAQCPGFPLWTVYSWIFVHVLPFSNYAWRVAVGSAFAAACSCGLIAFTVSLITRVLSEDATRSWIGRAGEKRSPHVLCGFIAGLGFGLSTSVWRMAVVAETWALSSLLFAVLLGCVTRWSLEPTRTSRLYVAIFLFGLLVVEDQELLVLVPALLGLILIVEPELGRDLALPISLIAVVGWVSGRSRFVPWFGTELFSANICFIPILLAGLGVCLKKRRVGSHWKGAGLCLILFLIGTGSYLVLPISSMTTPPADWFHPRTVDGFLHLISHGQYESPRPTDQLGPFLRQLRAFAAMSSQDFGLWYVICAVVPFCLIARVPRAVRNCLWGLGLVFLALGPILTSALNSGLDWSSTQFITPFFAPMYGVLAICAGTGIFAIGSLAGRWWPQRGSEK